VGPGGGVSAREAVRRLALVAVVVAAACATTGSRKQLVESAGTALGCPVEKMEVAAVSSTTHWVRGCGQVATFTLECGVADCTWKLQGKPVKRPTAAAPK